MLRIDGFQMNSRFSRIWSAQSNRVSQTWTLFLATCRSSLTANRCIPSSSYQMAASSFFLRIYVEHLFCAGGAPIKVPPLQPCGATL